MKCNKLTFAMLLLLSVSFATTYNYTILSDNSTWANLSGSTFYIYGNGTTARSNCDGTFIFCERFNGASVNTSRGTITINGAEGNYSIGSGFLQFNQTPTNGKYIRYETNSNLSIDYWQGNIIFSIMQQGDVRFHFTLNPSSPFEYSNTAMSSSNFSGAPYNRMLLSTNAANPSYSNPERWSFIFNNSTGNYSYASMKLTNGSLISLTSQYAKNTASQNRFKFLAFGSGGGGDTGIFNIYDIFVSVPSSVSVSYSPVENSIWSINGELFSQRVQINLSSSISNQAIELNSSKLPSGNKLLITNETYTDKDPYLVLFTPLQGAGLQNSTVNFSYSVNFSRPMTVNALLYVNDTLKSNQTGTTNTTFNFSTSLADSDYTWYVFAYNSSNKSQNSTSETRNFVVDTIPPYDLQLSLINNSNYYLSIPINLTFAHIASPQNCTIFINNIPTLMTVVNSTLCTYQITNTTANYSIYAQVFNNVGNSNLTPTYIASTFNYSAVSIFTNPEYDMALDTLRLNLNTTNYNGTILASLTYNNTSLAPTQDAAGFYYTVAPPSNSLTNTLVNIVWNITFVNSTPILLQSFTNQTNVSYTNLTDCSSGAKVLNFSFFDQDNLTTPTLSTMLATFNLHTYNLSNSRNYSLNFSTPVTNVSVCLNANNTTFYLDSIQAFTSPGHQILYYYLLNQSINSNSTTYVPLYNLATYESTATNYLIYSGASQPVVGAYVQILRYYPSTGQLLLVSMGQTNSQGIATSYAVPNNVIYRYVVVQGYSITYTSGTTPLPCDPSATLCSTTIFVSNVQPNEYNYFVNGVGVGCATNTTYVYCSSNNPSGTATQLTLNLYQIGEYSNPLICTNTLLAGSGTLVCAIPNSSNSYYYVATANLTSGNIIIGQGNINTTPTTTMDSVIGLFGALFMTIGFALFSSQFGFSAAIIGAFLGILLSFLLMFIAIPIEALIGLGIIAVVLGWILRG